MSVEELVEEALLELKREEEKEAEVENSLSKYIVTIGSVPIDTKIMTDNELKEVIKSVGKTGAKETAVYELISKIEIKK